MNGDNVKPTTPFYQIDTEKLPQSFKKKQGTAPYKIPYVNDLYHIYNPQDLEEYSA